MRITPWCSTTPAIILLRQAAPFRSASLTFVSDMLPQLCHSVRRVKGIVVEVSWTVTPVSVALSFCRFYVSLSSLFIQDCTSDRDVDFDDDIENRNENEDEMLVYILSIIGKLWDGSESTGDVPVITSFTLLLLGVSRALKTVINPLATVTVLSL